MGSYGIGVSRAVAAIAEMNCDDKGLIWPHEVSPADVHIVATGKAGDPQLPAAEQLAADCEAAGLRVLLDDRVGVSPGIKFNDAELIGVPTIVVVGRGLVDGRGRGQGPSHRRSPRRRPGRCGVRAVGSLKSADSAHDLSADRRWEDIGLWSEGVPEGSTERHGCTS